MPPRRDGVAVTVLIAAFAAFTATTLAVVRDWSPLMVLDDSVAEWAHALGVRLAWWTPSWVSVSTALSPWTLRIAMIGVAAWWVLRQVGRTHRWPGSVRFPRDLLFAGVAILAGGIVPVIVKVIVDRPRPGEALVHAVQTSYPSAHAFAAAAAAAVLVATVRRQRGYVIGAAIVAAALVSASRVCLAVHYVSDVAAGLVLGVAWTCGVWLVMRPTASRAARARSR